MGKFEKIHVVLAVLVIGLIFVAVIVSMPHQQDDRTQVTQQLSVAVASRAGIQSGQSSSGFQGEDWKRLAKVL